MTPRRPLRVSVTRVLSRASRVSTTTRYVQSGFFCTWTRTVVPSGAQHGSGTETGFRTNGSRDSALLSKAPGSPYRLSHVSWVTFSYLLHSVTSEWRVVTATCSCRWYEKRSVSWSLTTFVTRYEIPWPPAVAGGTDGESHS